MTASKPSAAKSDAEPLELRAGPLSLQWDDGGLRYIRLGETELVRRIYCAVRDANWGTVPGRISNLVIQQGDDSFHVEFDVTHQEGEIHFLCHGLIRGEADGKIVFEIDGVSKSDFRRNRIGFCVLHPMSLAGERLTVCRADGSRDETEFPRWIAPYNPFLNVVGMRHAAAAGVEVELTFAGDVFETEDQRNWLDASFKTFCTPLSQPFPVQVRAGDRVMQSVTIDLHGRPPIVRSAVAESQPICLEAPTASVGRLPQIGFDFPGNSPPLDDIQAERLRALKPAHLRCELRRTWDNSAVLRRAVQAAAALSTKLEVAIYLGPDPERELTALLELIRRELPPIARWVVFPEQGWATTRPVAEAAARVLRRDDSQVPVGGGTPANFLELNRTRPPIDCLDFVAWSQNPQVHATDEASLVETLAAHTALVESARQFSGGLPLVVGPITLKPRVNPYATGTWPPTPAPGEVPPDVDPRQRSLFAAAWTLGSLKYLAENGVQAGTYYELVGDKGLVETDGRVLPLYQVFADLAQCAGADVLPIESPAPLLFEALALRTGSRTRVLVANLSPRPRVVVLPLAAASAHIRILDAEQLRETTANPLGFRQRGEQFPVENGALSIALPPHAIARVDWTTQP